jgi:hypothetical protein
MAALHDEGEGEEEDMEELERELADLDRHILDHRCCTAKRILDISASHLVTLRLPQSWVRPSDPLVLALGFWTGSGPLCGVNAKLCSSRFIL